MKSSGRMETFTTVCGRLYHLIKGPTGSILRRGQAKEMELPLRNHFLIPDI